MTGTCSAAPVPSRRPSACVAIDDRRPAADDQPRTTRIPSATSTTCRTSRARHDVDAAHDATRSASAATTRRWSSAASESDGRVVRRQSRLDAAPRSILGHRLRRPRRCWRRRSRTRPSSARATTATHDYERLEFLGDAILGLVVVEEVYRRFPDLPEGDMTKIKISRRRGLDAGRSRRTSSASTSLIRSARARRGTGGRGMASALENVFEALVGALYLDGGLDAARTFVLATLGDRMPTRNRADDARAPQVAAPGDRCRRAATSPEYEIVAEEGPPHDRVLHARVSHRRRRARHGCRALEEGGRDARARRGARASSTPTEPAPRPAVASASAVVESSRVRRPCHASSDRSRADRSERHSCT